MSALPCPSDFAPEPTPLAVCEWCSAEVEEAEISENWGAKHCPECSAKFAAEELAAQDAEEQEQQEQEQGS